MNAFCEEVICFLYCLSSLLHVKDVFIWVSVVCLRLTRIIDVFLSIVIIILDPQASVLLICVVVFSVLQL